LSERYALPAEPRDPYLGAGLWGRRDLTLLLVPYALGGVGLVVAWYGSAKEADWRDDARWLVTGTGSVTLAGIGLFLWLVAGKLRIVAAERAVRSGLLERRAARQERLEIRSRPADGLVTWPGSRRYHRPSCLLMRGKPVVPATDLTGLGTCGVCEP
jgi:hypothetical protein